MKKEDQDILMSLMEKSPRVSLILAQDEIFFGSLKNLRYDQLSCLKEIADFYNSPKFEENKKKYCIDFVKRAKMIQDRMDLIKQAGNVFHNFNYN